MNEETPAIIIVEGQQIRPPSPVKGNKYQINFSVNNNNMTNVDMNIFCRVVI